MISNLGGKLVDDRILLTLSIFLMVSWSVSIGKLIDEVFMVISWSVFVGQLVNDRIIF